MNNILLAIVLCIALTLVSAQTTKPDERPTDCGACDACPAGSVFDEDSSECCACKACPVSSADAEDPCTPDERDRGMKAVRRPDSCEAICDFCHDSTSVDGFCPMSQDDCEEGFTFENDDESMRCCTGRCIRVPDTDPCATVDCADVECQDGYRKQNVEGRCCPVCIAVPRDCTEESRECITPVCPPGTISFRPASDVSCCPECVDCPERCPEILECGEGMISVHPAGSCCPRCVRDEKPDCTLLDCIMTECADDEVFIRNEHECCGGECRKICTDADRESCAVKECAENEVRVRTEDECCFKCQPRDEHEYCEERIAGPEDKCAAERESLLCDTMEDDECRPTCDRQTVWTRRGRLIRPCREEKEETAPSAEEEVEEPVEWCKEERVACRPRECLTTRTVRPERGSGCCPVCDDEEDVRDEVHVIRVRCKSDDGDLVPCTPAEVLERVESVLTEEQKEKLIEALQRREEAKAGEEDSTAVEITFSDADTAAAVSERIASEDDGFVIVSSEESQDSASNDESVDQNNNIDDDDSSAEVVFASIALMAVNLL